MRKKLRKLLIPACASVVALGLLGFMAARLFASTSPEDLIGRAKALATEGKYEEALTQVDQVISDHPGTDACTEARYLKGKYLEKLERWEEARDEYRTLVAQAPEGEMGQAVAEAFARLHRPKARPLMEGAEFLKEQLLNDPRNEVALRAAVRLLQVSQRAASLEERQQATQLLAGVCGEDSELEGARAEALGRIAGLQMLENMLAQLGQGPETSWIKLRLAWLYSTGGPCTQGYNPKLAMEMYQQVIAEAPGSPAAGRAHLALAESLWGRDLGERIAHFIAGVDLLSTEEMEGRATQINSLVADGIVAGRAATVREFLESVMQRNAGETLKTAAAQWREFIDSGCALSEASVVQLIALGNEYRAAGDFQTAIACADEVLGRNPERTFFIGAKSLKRDCYRTEDDLEDALQMALDVLATFPAEPHDESMMYVVWMYRLLGNQGKALEYAEKVIKTFPGTQWEALGLRDAGRISAELGDKETAARFFQQVIDRFPGTYYAGWAQEDMRRLEQ